MLDRHNARPPANPVGRSVKRPDALGSLLQLQVPVERCVGGGWAQHVPLSACCPACPSPIHIR